MSNNYKCKDTKKNDLVKNLKDFLVHLTFFVGMGWGMEDVKCWLT